MTERVWEAAYRAFKQALRAHEQAMDELLQMPVGDRASYDEAIETARKLEEARKAFNDAVPVVNGRPRF